jgi:hypothetical protein
LLWFWFGSLTALTAVAAVIAMPVDDSGTTEHCLTTGWRVTVIAGDRDPGETQMSEIRILVHNVPPEGWQWRLVAGGNTLKSGSAKTETEAHHEANAALRRLKEENRPTDTN